MFEDNDEKSVKLNMNILKLYKKQIDGLNDDRLCYRHLDNEACHLGVLKQNLKAWIKTFVKAIIIIE